MDVTLTLRVSGWPPLWLAPPDPTRMAKEVHGNRLPVRGGASLRQQGQEKHIHEMLLDIWWFVNCFNIFKKENIFP